MCSKEADFVVKIIFAFYLIKDYSAWSIKFRILGNVYGYGSWKVCFNHHILIKTNLNEFL